MTVHSVVVPPAAETDFGTTGWTFLWLQGGAGYWLGSSGASGVGLEADDVAIFYGPGRFRGSQLTASTVVVYSITPQNLGGVVSAEERQAIDAAGRTNPFRKAEAATDRAARGRVALGAPELSALARRCRLIELLADFFADELAVAATPRGAAGALERLNDWLRKQPESAIASITLEQFATELSCSPRHLSRLFQGKFNVSFREHQLQLRLEKAKRLLTESDAKVIDVALESGYRHLGLFNNLFKRRFGMTPSEWRKGKRRSSPSLTVIGAASLALLAASPLRTVALAAEPTNAPARTPKSAPEKVFEIKGYDVIGNTLLPTNIVYSVVSDFTGPQSTFGTVSNALVSLQMAYRGRGWATVSVEVPVQKFTNGIVKLKVTEGRLVDIQVIGNQWVSVHNVRRALPGVHTNMFLNSKIFEADLAIANENPDRQIYPRIIPGPDPGTTALVLKVKDQLPLHGRVEVNDQNTPGTPELRTSTSLQYNNLFERDHSIGVQYTLSPQLFKESGDLNIFDRPAIASYSGYYRIPLEAPHSIGEEVAAQPQRFGFDEVTKKFVLPPTTGRPELNLYASRLTTDPGVQYGAANLVNTNGTVGGVSSPVTLIQQQQGRQASITEDIGGRLTVPVALPLLIRGVWSFGLDLKNYQRTSYNTNVETITYRYKDPNSTNINTRTTVLPLPRPTEMAGVNYLPLSLRWDGSRPDKWGATSLGLGAAADFSGGPFSPSPAFSNVTGSPNAAGGFFILQMSAERDFTLPDEWSVAVRADGQWVNEPVISNEQFSVGGSAGVRGYQEGARYGDRGWRSAIEPRTPLIDIGLVDGTMPFRFRGIAFMDYGRSYLLGAPATGLPTLETLWGAGAGVSGSVGTTVDFRCTVAWALRSAAGSDAGSYRIYFGVGAQF